MQTTPRKSFGKLAEETRVNFQRPCFLDIVKFSLPHSKRCCFHLLVGLCLEN